MIRSLLFYIAATIWLFIVGIIFSPVIFLPSRFVIIIVGKVWAGGTYYLLKTICNLSVVVKGKKFMPKHSAIYASKHQSALETFMYLFILNKPVFILKKELLKLPVIGFYMKKMGMIAIDRNGGIKSLKFLLEQVQEKINDGYSIVIFPEGTRTSPGKTVDYHPGIAAIYNLKAAPVIPVALNTGMFWPKDTILKKPGKTIIEFLPAISNELDKRSFMEELKKTIEEKCLVISRN
ncbi:MAG: lysophospholipid acyltransferase family protein [Pseudomonadota bacterium]